MIILSETNIGTEETSNYASARKDRAFFRAKSSVSLRCSDRVKISQCDEDRHRDDCYSEHSLKL